MKEASRILPFLPDFSSFFPTFPDFFLIFGKFLLSGVALCPPCHPSGYATDRGLQVRYPVEEEATFISYSDDMFLSFEVIVIIDIVVFFSYRPKV